MESEQDVNTAVGRQLHALVRMPAWTASKAEELLAVAWLVAGLNAWSAGIRWLAWLLFAKAGLDTGCALLLAILEKRAEWKL